MNLSSHLIFSRYMVSFLSVALLLMALIGSTGLVYADQYDDQINALNEQNSLSRGAVSNLVSQAGSYEQAVGNLQSQISALLTVLNDNLKKQAAAQQQINDLRTKLAQQKKLLGDDIRAMYMDGQLTTIEQLATSKNLSDYVDREEYRTRVQNKIYTIVQEVASLQAQMQKQKDELDGLVNTQKEQSNSLASAQSQQQQLLAYNENQRAGFNQQIAANNDRMTELRKQQLAANVRFTSNATSGGACGGGYPGVWCNAPQGSLLDTWGMYNRECVSYAAFRVANSGREMPGWGWLGLGNANQWDDNAKERFPVDTLPRQGDVAISNSEPYGHAMYVESVNGDGSINISQYNADLRGNYATATLSAATIAASRLVFIHF